MSVNNLCKALLTRCSHQWLNNLPRVFQHGVLYLATSNRRKYMWLHCLILWRRYDQNNLIQYGRRRHVEFTSGLHFDTFSRLGRQNVFAYQILCKSVNILRSYDVSNVYVFTYVYIQDTVLQQPQTSNFEVYLCLCICDVVFHSSLSLFLLPLCNFDVYM